MSIQTLSNVTLETIENYRNAATFAVEAYRTGSHRLIDAVNSGLVNNVYNRTGKVAPNLTNALTQVRGSLSDIIVKGVDGVSANTEKAIVASSSAAAERVTQVAEFAAGIDNRVVVTGLEAAVRFGMPGAKAALAVSAKVAEGAGALSRVAAGKPVKAVRTVKKAVKQVAVRTKRAVARKAAAAPKAAPRKLAVKKAVARAPRKVTEAAAA